MSAMATKNTRLLFPLRVANNYFQLDFFSSLTTVLIHSRLSRRRLCQRVSQSLSLSLSLSLSRFFTLALCKQPWRTHK